MSRVSRSSRETGTGAETETQIILISCVSQASTVTGLAYSSYRAGLYKISTRAGNNNILVIYRPQQSIMYMNIDKIGYVYDMIKCLNDSKVSDWIMWWGKQFQSLIALGKMENYMSQLLHIGGNIC